MSHSLLLRYGKFPQVLIILLCTTHQLIPHWDDHIIMHHTPTRTPLGFRHGTFQNSEESLVKAKYCGGRPMIADSHTDYDTY